MKEDKAVTAMDKEWNKLAFHKRPNPKDKGIGAWDILSVRNKRDVMREARASGKTIHHGRIAELCTQKNSELPDGHENKMYKGRAVLLGDNIRDEDFNWAAFADLGSSPPSLEACRNLDALSCLPGFETWTGDANGAYCQSYLENEDGIITWVTLPEHRWPARWKNADGTCKYDEPVVILILALYGHPKAGKLWENDCTKRVEKCGWEVMSESWPNVFWQPLIMAFPLVYVDDFKLVAPKGLHKELWKKLKGVIDMGEEELEV